jgi:hypothetical protein
MQAVVNAGILFMIMRRRKENARVKTQKDYCKVSLFSDDSRDVCGISECGGSIGQQGNFQKRKGVLRHRV